MCCCVDMGVLPQYFGARPEPHGMFGALTSLYRPYQGFLPTIVVTGYVGAVIYLAHRRTLERIPLGPDILLLRLRPKEKARWYRPSHCPHCKYDLRGNVSGRCPECGKRIAGGTVPDGHWDE